MKKYLLMIPALVAVGFMLPMTASANAKGCSSLATDLTYYQGKAAAAWTAYGGCKGFEWMGGKTKSHCKAIHKHAESWQKTANRLAKEEISKKCIND